MFTIFGVLSKAEDRKFTDRSCTLTYLNLIRLRIPLFSFCFLCGSSNVCKLHTFPFLLVVCVCKLLSSCRQDSELV